MTVTAPISTADLVAGAVIGLGLADGAEYAHVYSNPETGMARFDGSGFSVVAHNNGVVEVSFQDKVLVKKDATSKADAVDIGALAIAYYNDGDVTF